MDYLAFDFGDGTTCAAHYDDSFAQSNTAPQKLNIARGMDEIWSIIGYDRNGDNPCIGKAANKPGYSIRSNWKAKPSQYTSKGPEAWKRQTCIDFMQKAFDNFHQNNPDYKKDGTKQGQTYAVVIGVPCDWSEKDIDAYKEMAKEAGIPNVQVVKESQAAMFYARRFMRGGIPDKDILKGVLLIDVGSSTTDFTYMKGADQVGHCGLALGAQTVEHSFLVEAQRRQKIGYCTNKAPQGARILAANQEDGERMFVCDALQVRGFKEAYFRERDQSKDHYEETSSSIQSKIHVGEVSDDGRRFITGAYVNYCLNDENSPCKFRLKQLSSEWDGLGLDEPNTWRGHFRAALQHVRNKWNLNSETSIVVTGGATRMQFIEEDIVEIFHPVKKPYFGNDGDRSFSVVKGLAWAAYAKHSLNTAQTTIEEIVESEEVREVIADFVCEYISQPAVDIADSVYRVIVPLLRRHDSSVGSLRKLDEKYSQVITSELNKFIKKTNGGVNISSLLEKPVIRDINKERQAEFARPDIKIDKNVTAAIPWTYGQLKITFDPFEDHDFICPSDIDESFDGILGMGKMYDNAADGFIKSFSAETIMEIFLNDEMTNQNGEPMPSDFEILYWRIAEKVKEFVSAEIAAMAGTIEYGSK